MVSMPARTLIPIKICSLTWCRLASPESDPDQTPALGQACDSEPPVPTQASSLSPTTASGQTTRFPHGAAGEFSSPVNTNGGIGTGVAGPDGLPDQKIFPGIVHARIRRGSILAPSSVENHHD